MKSGASDPFTTKNMKEGGELVPASTIFFAQSLWCLCVGKWHHFWWWTVGEVNWLCRQAGQANNQSTYLDVNGGASCSNGREFESRHPILDGHFFTNVFVVKICNVFEKTKTNEKEARVGHLKKFKIGSK